MGNPSLLTTEIVMEHIARDHAFNKHVLIEEYGVGLHTPDTNNSVIR